MLFRSEFTDEVAPIILASAADGERVASLLLFLLWPLLLPPRHNVFVAAREVWVFLKVTDNGRPIEGAHDAAGVFVATRKDAG